VLCRCVPLVLYEEAIAYTHTVKNYDIDPFRVGVFPIYLSIDKLWV